MVDGTTSRCGSWALLSGLVAAACSAPTPTDTVVSIDDVPATVRGKAPEPLWLALAGRQSQPLILALTSEAQDPRAWAARKHALLAAAREAADALGPDELELEHEWQELPLVQVRAASLDAALATIDRDEVIAVYPVERLERSDTESFALIKQPAAVAAGKIGSGTAVAVLDTGTDYTHAAFGSCTAPGVPATTCRVAYAADIAPEDGSRDAHGHGTNVAGIVAGTAPGTRIIALDVFNGGGAYSSDVITAINWAIANKATYKIAAVNLSLGGGAFTSPCTSNSIGTALGQARAAGIAPVVASGNGALSNAISSPACSPSAVSVGAVYDANVGGLQYGNCTDATTAADKIACFSNSASFLTLLAPGALINAAGITMAGTSQAAPHVAGAFAVLRGAYPNETVEQLLARLTSTGAKLTDPRNSVITSRIDIAAAVGAPTTDASPPTGTVSINGNAAATKTAAVSLSISATDPSGVGEMCVTNTTTCTTYQPIATTRAWSLATGDGVKTVTVFLRDTQGNTTTATTSPKDTITLDTTPPVNGSMTATPGNAQVTLTWKSFSDATSGVASYRVVGAASATPPTTCGGTALYSGTATSFTATGLTNGKTYSYRVCAVDVAGNLSTGATAAATPVPDSTPPTGSIVLAAGASLFASRTLSVALSATDASGVASMCLTESTACTTYVPYATTTTFTVGGDGTRTVRVRFRDRWGNTSQAVSASILIDTVAPAGGVLSVVPSPVAMALSWTAATDATTSLARYLLVAAKGGTPPAPRCASGTVLATGTATQFAHSIVATETWSYRLCAIDRAGNVSTGSVVTATAPAFVHMTRDPVTEMTETMRF